MKTFIGVDLGGTNVRVAIVDETGNVVLDSKEKSEVHNGPEYVMQKIIKMIESLDGYEHCSGIGLGVPGPVDTVNGKIIVTNNLPGFAGFPIAKTIEDHFKIPTFMDNDVNVAGLGEATLGAGKGHRSVYYVTISTGIGGALMINGKVEAGAHGHAGELCNIIIDRNREKLKGLNPGAFENEASGTALVRKGKKLLGDSIEDAKDIFELATKGNKDAIHLVDEMAHDMAQVFAAISLIVDPSIFVLGGGVMKSKKSFFDAFEKYYRSMIFEGMQSIKFEVASLKEPGIVGAAMLPIANIRSN